MTENDRTDLEALVWAAWQALDDFGAEGKSVCGATKAQLRMAIEPFKVIWADSATEPGLDYSVDAAEALLKDL